MAEKQKDPRKVLTPEFRVSFPNVFRPTAMTDGQPKKYSIVMLFPKSADLRELKRIARQAALEKWPDKTKRPENIRIPFRDGNEKQVDGYKDVIFCSATSMQRPGLVDAQLKDIVDPTEFYAGCWARATVTAFAYDRAGNRGIAFGLQNIQKLRDDDAFSGRSKAEDDFEPVDVAEVKDPTDDFIFDDEHPAAGAKPSSPVGQVKDTEIFDE